jgi:hypothetical protein
MKSATLFFTYNLLKLGGFGSILVSSPKSGYSLSFINQRSRSFAERLLGNVSRILTERFIH